MYIYILILTGDTRYARGPPEGRIKTSNTSYFKTFHFFLVEIKNEKQDRIHRIIFTKKDG